MAVRRPLAIIDIGSNSVRLVVYSGAERVPTPIFNEKVMAGLGSGLDESGELGRESMDRTLTALSRFRLLIRHMEAGNVWTVATAAVRDAANGAEFVTEINRIGLKCEVLSAKQEARLAGQGVLSAIPDARGIVGDLGGGSLELVEVGDGKVRNGLSLPLGVLRLATRGSGRKAAARAIRAGLSQLDLGKIRGRRFYMVGGSWRALARMHMAATEFPLPVTHQYRIRASEMPLLQRLAESPDSNWGATVPPARQATAPAAAMILAALVDELEPRELILSAYGIREGLLYSALGDRAKAADPLIEAARDAGGAEHRFGPHGELLDGWIGGLFDDGPELARLRLASCLLSDVAWQATAPFRADRGIEMALHGNWVAVDAPGRVIMAQALSASFGRDRLPDESLARLCKPVELERARQWGFAMRLGQRLSGGLVSVLESTAVALTKSTVQLIVGRRDKALVGEAVHRRLEALAEVLGRGAAIVVR